SGGHGAGANEPAGSGVLRRNDCRRQVQRQRRNHSGCVRGRRRECRGQDERCRSAGAENVACPGAGACGGQYTANTMSTVMELIGLSPMGFNGIPAMDPRKDDVSFRCGEVVMNLLKRGIKPSDILTHAAFENAIAGVATTGGSTNAVLHLLAISREMGLPLEIDDFQRVSERTPLLADLKPAGKFVAADVDAAGGIPVIAKRLLDGKYVDGSALTVTGKTFAEEANRAIETVGQTVIAPLSKPL